MPPIATESIPDSNGNGINSGLQRQRNKFRTPTAKTKTPFRNLTGIELL
jgi:hypothetical protein